MTPGARQSAVLLLAGLLWVSYVHVGCAGSERVVRTQGRTADGALLKLEQERDKPIWKDWKPDPGHRAAPSDLDDSVRAFDYWQVDDAEVVEEIWTAIFPVIDTVRAQASVSERRKSLDLMLEVIEPGQTEGQTRMDLTFLVSSSESSPYEGVACRFYRRLEAGVTPAITVVLLRRPDEASTPGRIVVWAAPRFDEPEPLTALFDRTSDRWHQSLSSGLHLPSDDQAQKGVEHETGRLAARLLTDAIWNRFAGRAYLESPQSGLESDRAHPEDIEDALGLDVTDRDISQVYSHTEFPPRADLDDF